MVLSFPLMSFSCGTKYETDTRFTDPLPCSLIALTTMISHEHVIIRIVTSPRPMHWHYICSGRMVWILWIGVGIWFPYVKTYILNLEIYVHWIWNLSVRILIEIEDTENEKYSRLDRFAVLIENLKLSTHTHIFEHPYTYSVLWPKYLTSRQQYSEISSITGLMYSIFLNCQMYSENKLMYSDSLRMYSNMHSDVMKRVTLVLWNE